MPTSPARSRLRADIAPPRGRAKARLPDSLSDHALRGTGGPRLDSHALAAGRERA